MRPPYLFNDLVLQPGENENWAFDFNENSESNYQDSVRYYSKLYSQDIKSKEIQKLYIVSELY